MLRLARYVRIPQICKYNIGIPEMCLQQSGHGGLKNGILLEKVTYQKETSTQGCLEEFNLPRDDPSDPLICKF